MTHPYWTPYKELAAKAKLGSCWSEPICSSFGQVLGTFAIYHHEAISPTEADFYIIEQSAHLASIAIERRRLESEIYLLAFNDSLTRLPNRRLLVDRLTQAMATCKRTGVHGALVFLDLDNFKPLNDSHGHAAGDLLLIDVANRLKSCVRETDTVARIGGDEFVVLLSELGTERTHSSALARTLAEKVRTILSEPYLLTIKHERMPDTLVEHRCTASVGVTLFANNDESHDDILKRADDAMYQAKQAGRNQVRFDDSGA